MQVAIKWLISLCPLFTFLMVWIFTEKENFCSAVLSLATVILLKIEKIKLDTNHVLADSIIEGFIHFNRAAILSLVFCIVHLIVAVFVLERETVTKFSSVWNWVSMLASLAFSIWLFTDGITATVWIIRNNYSAEYSFLLFACTFLAVSGCVYARRFYREATRNKQDRNRANGLKYWALFKDLVVVFE